MMMIEFFLWLLVKYMHFMTIRELPGKLSTVCCGVLAIVFVLRRISVLDDDCILPVVVDISTEKRFQLIIIIINSTLF